LTLNFNLLKKLKEIEIGLITVIAIAVLYWGINYLKGINLFNSKRTFYAIYDQVNGLVTSNVVTVNGYKIGIVENISFIHGDPKGRLLVKFSINNKDIEIPANSVAKIQNDLLGTASIVILIGNSPEKAKSGDTLKSALATTLQQEVSLQMLPIKTKAENLMLSLDSVLAVIQYVFNEQTRENLSRSFESIKITIKNLEHTSFNIDTLMSTQRNRISMILANIESISNNLKNNNDKISHIINNFSTISDTLAKSNINKTINKTNEVLTEFNGIVSKINSGQGSLGLLINNDSLYYNLEAVSKNLNLMLQDIKNNPQRYLNFSVFGGGKRKNKN